MNAKDDFRIQIYWSLICLTSIDAILMFLSINRFPEFHPHGWPNQTITMKSRKEQ